MSIPSNLEYILLIFAPFELKNNEKDNSISPASYRHVGEQSRTGTSLRIILLIIGCVKYAN